MANVVITATTPGPCGCCAPPSPCRAGVPDESACSVECSSFAFLWTVTPALTFSFPDSAEFSGCFITINADGSVTGGGTWHKTDSRSNQASLSLHIGGNQVAQLVVGATAPGDYSFPSSSFVTSFPTTGTSEAKIGNLLDGATTYTLGTVSIGNVTGTSCSAYYRPDDPYFGMVNEQSSTWFAHCTGLIPGCDYRFTIDLGTDVEEVDFTAFDVERFISGSVPLDGTAGACTIARIIPGEGGGGGPPPAL